MLRSHKYTIAAIWSKPSLGTVKRCYSSKHIFAPYDDEEEVNRKKEQLSDDKPWDGEESVKDAVLRMIVDKYRAPLRVEGAARRNLPQPQPYPPHIMQQFAQDKSPGKKQVERERKNKAMKQNRLMNAKDAALDYSLGKKYPTTNEEGDSNVSRKEFISINDIGLLCEEKIREAKDAALDYSLGKKYPTTNEEGDSNVSRKEFISINDIGLLCEEKIREAKAKGEFDNLPGSGKPLQEDYFKNNPYLDQTEYLLNRIVQRNGAAPPWVIMQQEVDTELNSFKLQLSLVCKRCIDELKEEGRPVLKTTLVQRFNQAEKSFFEKQVSSLNSRVRSYNVMCPSPVRKQLLELDKELASVMEKYVK
ncbi:hypothetical protein RMCBS344292_13409 [Rhizopus microsporus]|nr:hypothetical protein RMCBS344292_13409 [Rhizopus microsporus]